MHPRKTGRGSIVISSAADIARLRASARQMWSWQAPVAIDAVALDPGTRSRWESRINALGDACGCTEASITGGIATIVVIAGWIYFDIPLSGRSLGIAVLGVIGIALIAKLTSVLVAKLRLRHALTGLLHELSDTAGRRPHGDMP